MTVLDVSQMGVVIIEVVITSDSYPCFVSGASSSLESFDEAAIKAFQEAESRLIYGLNEQSTRELTPEHVHSVLDHEALYAQSRLYHEHLEFLFEGEISKTIPEVATSIDTLRRKLDAVVVNVSEEDSALRVVKALSPKLVPISFGFGAGHYSHHSLACVVDKHTSYATLFCLILSCVDVRMTQDRFTNPNRKEVILCTPRLSRQSR